MLKISFKYMWRFGKYYVISSEITWHRYNLKNNFFLLFLSTLYLLISSFFIFDKKAQIVFFYSPFYFICLGFWNQLTFFVFGWFPLGFKLTFSCAAYLFLALKYFVYFCQDKVLWSSYLYFYEFYGDIKRLHLTSY